jgi:hypothetical protein
MRSFGRRFASDDRDRKFLMRRMLPDARRLALATRKAWFINPNALDQGQTGTCVGHAWRNFLRCAPIRTEKSGPSAFDVYRSAVLKDPWASNELPDGDPGLDDGTTVRAGAQAVTDFGRLRSYVWAFSLQSAVEWVLTEGPVVLGTNWYSSMSEPDRQGVATIKPTARVIGGHAYLLRGVDTRKALARCCNSWGDGWGKSGEFFIPFRDLERLIHEDGEACSAVQKRLTPKAAVPPPAKAFVPKARGRKKRKRASRR